MTMKNLQKIPLLIVRISAMILIIFVVSVAWAQDKGVDINVDIGKKGGNWYNNPIVYVIGGAVFILLLVALLKNGSKSSS
jgi:hypothetical protein